MEHNLNVKVGMLIIMVKNVEQAIEFYKKLGLPVKFHLKEKWAELNVGGISLGLCPTDEQLPDRHTGIILQVSDAKKAFEMLAQEGVEFVREPAEALHGIMASIKDPSGNIMDLYQPTPERVEEMVRQMKENPEASECGCAPDCCDSDCSDCKH